MKNEKTVDTRNCTRQPGCLPDHRWIAEKQKIIVRPEDVGEPAGVPVCNQGMCFAENGDLLMAVLIVGGGYGPHGRDSVGPPRMVLLRSADGGETWSQQGQLDLGRSEVGQEIFVGLLRLGSGRLVGFLNSLDQQCHVEKYQKASDPYFIEGGHNIRFDVMRSAQRVVYSDDGGKTWHYVPIDISPFRSMTISDMRGSIFESADGTLVQPFIGHLSQDELDSGIESTGIIRSRDGGLTWGDTSIVHKGQPGSGWWYNETAILELTDGRWLALMRLNDNDLNGLLAGCRSYSEDKGYTWSYPVHTRFPIHEPALEHLSGGAVIRAHAGLGYEREAHFTVTGAKWQEIGPERSGKHPGILYAISHDDGLTWSYWGTLYRADAGSPEHIGSVNILPLGDNTAIAVYHRGIDTATALKQGGYGPMVIGASWLRKVPADSPEAAGLEYPEWLVEASLENAIASAEKIVTLPEEWRFRFDPDSQGLEEGWHKQTSFEGWDRIPLDFSGLMAKHSAHHFPSRDQAPEPRLQNLDIPWYATTFQMPETGGIPLLILFCAVDGFCDVFVDGRKAGGQELSQFITKQRPFGIVLADGLSAGRHMLVVRLRKEYPLSAGIFKPVYIVAESDVPLPPHATGSDGGSIQ